MRFTLTLSDYVDQYIANQDNDQMHCPVCYEQEMTGDKKKDILQLIECYKLQLVEQRLRLLYLEHGYIPKLTDQFMEQVMESVDQELLDYYIKHDII